MNFRKIYCIAAMALMCCTGSMFTSCDDYLDVDSYFDEIFELDSVFKRKEYLEVLERKSLRLKVLIEDLFEISKATSKNVDQCLVALSGSFGRELYIME